MVSRGAWWVIAALAASCSFDGDYAGTSYICKLDRCPSGYVCIDEVCVTGASDAAATDGAPLDGPVTDGPVADGPAADSREPPSCDEQFGAANGYQLCSETPTTCTFDVMADNTSCDDQCALFGSTCEDARDSDAGAPCVDSGGTSCGTPHNAVMCTCAR